MFLVRDNDLNRTHLKSTLDICDAVCKVHDEIICETAIFKLLLPTHVVTNSNLPFNNGFHEILISADTKQNSLVLGIVEDAE